MGLFKVGTGEKPDLIQTGIPIVDSTIGGLSPGTLMVIGAEQGVGKSGMVLSAVVESPVKAGAIFLEDSAELAGTRLLAYFSGVNSLKFRFNDFTQGELAALSRAQEELDKRDDIILRSRVGASIEEIEEEVADLGSKGCRLIFLDYLTKVRGVHESRRSEVGIVMTRFQRACEAVGAVPVLASQLRRRGPTKKNPNPRYDEPLLQDFKESGDIEAEARVALLLWPDKNESTVHGRFAKSSFGGEGGRFNYVRLGCGSLKPVSPMQGREWRVLNGQG
jgi:replicative DNA helicase